MSDLYDLAHVAGQKLYRLHDLGHLGQIPHNISQRQARI